MKNDLTRYLTITQTIMIFSLISLLNNPSPVIGIIILLFVTIVNLIYHSFNIYKNTPDKNTLKKIIKDILSNKDVTLSSIETKKQEWEDQKEKKNDIQTYLQILIKENPTNESEITDFLYEYKVLWAGPVKYEYNEKEQMIILKKHFYIYNPFFILLFYIKSIELIEMFDKIDKKLFLPIHNNKRSKNYDNKDDNK